MERLPTNYSQIKDMKVLAAEDLLNIELMAKTLQLDDCLAALFLTASDLDDRELNIATRVHAKGRQLGVKEAGDNLFNQMRNRTGTLACLEYLRQMSSTFVMEVGAATSSNGNGFSFNVYPPGSRPEGINSSSESTVLPFKGDKL